MKATPLAPLVLGLLWKTQDIQGVHLGISKCSSRFSEYSELLRDRKFFDFFQTDLVMTTPDPLANSYATFPPSISSKTFHIAGILTTVYGLEELSEASKSISCLWLLHPRLGTKQVMKSVASTCIDDWNRRRSSDRTVGLIAVAFDQRNHGSREVTPLANEAWKGGNPTHAQDMFRYGLILTSSFQFPHI